jgi:hypothetical protein
MEGLIVLANEFYDREMERYEKSKFTLWNRFLIILSGCKGEISSFCTAFVEVNLDFWIAEKIGFQLLVDRLKHPILILFFSFSKNKYCLCDSKIFEWFAKLRVFPHE